MGIVQPIIITMNPPLLSHLRRAVCAFMLCVCALTAAFAQERYFFWDNPELFSPSRGGFPQTASCEAFAVAAWQEADSRAPLNAEASADYGDIYISLAVLAADGGEWTQRPRVAGPFPYAGVEPSLFSLTVDKTGKIFLCAAVNTNDVELYCSEDRGASWSRTAISPQSAGVQLDHARNGTPAAPDALVPKLFQMADGSYELFIVRSDGQAIMLYFARSTNGKQWSSFQPFVTEAGMPLSFLPCHIVIGGEDVIVFQSFISTRNHSAYQLYLKRSTNSGLHWSRARRLTDFRDPSLNTDSPSDAFNNERAHLSLVDDTTIFMVWERRDGAGAASVYGQLLTAGGSPASEPERINNSPVNCQNPAGFVYKGGRYVLWFDNRHGAETVIAAVRTGVVWENIEMSRRSERAIFARPVAAGGQLYVFWQELPESGSLVQSRIYVLGPDHSVTTPQVSALNFTPGRRAGTERARVSWTMPEDTSGIEGFSWSWSADPAVEPEKRLKAYADTTTAELNAASDGPWYFKVRALDFAGNWSASAGTVFVRDKTPPPPIEFIAPRVDGDGFLLSNTFTLRWQPSSAGDLAGYAWSADYMGPASQATITPAGGFSAAPAAVRVQGVEPRANYENHDNGLWHFTVWAIDDVGNVSAGRTLNAKLNKYIPHTYITWVDFEQDFMGDVEATLVGRGFTDSGVIRRVSFVPAGEGVERVLEAEDFEVDGDRRIILKRVANLKAGVYYITVEHPVRGVARSPGTFAVGPSLTYKFGDFTKYWEASWFVRFTRGFVMNGWTVLAAAAVVLCAVLAGFTLRGAALVFAESRALRLETLALLYGLEMPGTKKRRFNLLRRRSAGLRLKLASFTVALVVFVVTMVATPLYLMMLRSQRHTMMQSLWDRSTVLLESIAAGARTFLPTQNVLEIGFLPAQSVSVSEANYVTITGFGAQTSTSSDFVWASNDKNLQTKITTNSFQPGVSRIADDVTERVQTIENQLNERTRTIIGPLAKSLDELYREGAEIVLHSGVEPRYNLESLDTTGQWITQRISAVFAELSSTIYSVPEFDVDKNNARQTTFILLKPVMFRQTGSDIYVRGWVRLEISSRSIETEIIEAQRRTLMIILFITLAALALGGTLSFILATFIVLPLRSLVSHVELIRDTEDKTILEGKDIVTKTSDEIGILGNRINDMTRELVNAAMASRDLSIGKEIQKKFIPLEVDANGNKLTAGYKSTDYVEFFGYYEGAKGVSGDYFDYRDLDGRYYAIIKCDVAGKGIPAALIMIQVATMYINFFRRWKPDAHGLQHFDDLVYQINAFIEELGFKGRFAAFTLCLLDSHTGIARFCNAGDNLIHIYDASEQKLKLVALPQTPAAGVLTNAVVQKKGGYTVQTLTLDPGDTLLLYTDGIEEAKRRFRNSNYEEIECTFNNAPRGTVHANHVVGESSEEFGEERIHAIINAVMNKGRFDLYKQHNPHGEVRYRFDFSDCPGSTEDIIMALVSIEKLFRIWKNRVFKAGSRILVDKKIDAYLQKHFLDYNLYCAESAEYTENSAYKYYLNMSEDEQYDDLTILGVRRKEL